MNSLKKTVAVLIAAASLAACGGGATSNEATSTTVLRQKNGAFTAAENLLKKAASAAGRTTTTSTSTTTTTEAPKDCKAGYACFVGDIGPGGGKVIYDAGATQTVGRYLEVALADIGSTNWCNITTSVIGAGETIMGSGAANTLKIDSACSSGAGQLAADYVSKTGASDWYLPSREELDVVCKYANGINTASNSARSCSDAIRAGGVVKDTSFSAAYYWTSTEWSDIVAVYQAMYNGGTYTGFKTNNVKAYVNGVRPVRAFSAQF